MRKFVLAVVAGLVLSLTVVPSADAKDSQWGGKHAHHVARDSQWGG